MSGWVRIDLYLVQIVESVRNIACSLTTKRQKFFKLGWVLECKLASCLTLTDTHHEKTDPKVFVYVAAPILLLVWHRLFRIRICWRNNPDQLTHQTGHFMESAACRQLKWLLNVSQIWISNRQHWQFFFGCSFLSLWHRLFLFQGSVLELNQQILLASWFGAYGRWSLYLHFYCTSELLAMNQSHGNCIEVSTSPETSVMTLWRWPP